MKTFRILSLLCFMSGLSLVCTKAQVSPEIRYNHTSKNAGISFYNLDTSSRQKNGLCLFRTTSLTSPWCNTTEISKTIFLARNKNCNELLNISNLYSENGINLKGRPSSGKNPASSVTFNAKWESLTGKPIIDKSRVYYSPLKRTNNAAFSNNQFYHTGASIFNFVMNTKYPSINKPK